MRHLNNRKIIGAFNKQELQKANQSKFRIKKVIKNKVDKLYV